MTCCLDDPICLAALGTVEPVPIVPVPPDPGQSNAGGWALLAFITALVVIDLWLLWTGRPTMSKWVKGKTRGLRWWKAFGIAVIGVALWHLFEGGPL